MSKAIDDVWKLIDGKMPIFEFVDDGKLYVVHSTGEVLVQKGIGYAYLNTQGIVVNRIRPTLDFILAGRPPRSMKLEELAESTSRQTGEIVFCPSPPAPIDVHRLLDQLIALQQEKFPPFLVDSVFP